MSTAPTWDKNDTASVVTAIPGYNEDSSTGGKARNSAIPADLDGMFHGDNRLELPTDLTSALGSKSLEEYTQSFPNYRLNTGVNIKFNTDGQTIPEYDVTWEYAASPVTLEGGAGETNRFRQAPLDSLDGTQQYLDAHTAGPFTREGKVTVEGIEGVRGSIIYGGNDPYIVKMQEAGYLMSAAHPAVVPLPTYQYYTQIPYFYAFVDYVFMADGTKLVRVWDASVYPLHALYVTGTRRRKTTFREGIEWTVDAPIWEDKAFLEFVRDSRWPDRTPFRPLAPLNYDAAFGAGHGDHPVMEYREGGTNLTVSEVESQESSPFVPGLI